ncbi:MAG: hypothetical protein IJS71_02380 [Clostridia bacterium]|nr:hypothetical protein [Clostridia bacterium]
MKDFIANVKKTPVVLIFVSLVTGIGCFAVQFNPFTKEFASLSRIFKTDYPQLLTSMAEWLRDRATDPTLLVTTIAIAFLTVLGVSLISGFFTSGFSFVLYINTYNSIHRIPKKVKTMARFREGINKRFWNMTVYTFLTIISFALIVFLLAYINMPMAVSVGKVIGGDTSQILPMLLLIAVMLVVTFFVTVFFSMYVSYTMPSIVAFKTGGARVAFKIVNAYCWYLIPRTLLFIGYNLVIEILLLAIGYGLSSPALSGLVFVLNFLLRTAGIMYYVYYVFKTYIEMKEDMFDVV